MEHEGLVGVDSAEELIQIPILLFSDRWFRIEKSFSIENWVEIFVYADLEHGCVCLESIRSAQGQPEFYYA